MGRAAAVHPGWRGLFALGLGLLLPACGLETKDDSAPGAPTSQEPIAGEPALAQRTQATVGATCAIDSDCGDPCQSCVSTLCVADVGEGCTGPATSDCITSYSCGASGTCDVPAFAPATADCDDGPAATDCAPTYKCDGAGACATPQYASTSTSCDSGVAATDCTPGYLCDGSGNCNVPDHASASTSCDDGVTTSDCTPSYRCDGNGTCNQPQHANPSTSCDDGVTLTDCTPSYRCDGSGTCNVPQHATTSTNCDDGVTLTTCTPQYRCDGSGTCNAPQHAGTTTSCTGPPTTDCLTGYRCNGSGACSNAVFAGSGTSCDDGPAPTDCRTGYQCNGTGACSTPVFASSGTACDEGPAVTDCITAYTCNASGNCNTPVFASGTTACDDGPATTTCTPSYRCNGSGNCNQPQHANGAACTDGIACTTGDACQSGSCIPGTPDHGQCPDSACGTGTCTTSGCDLVPLPGGTTCRAATDVCDITETCNGSITTCPADAVRPATFECQAASCAAGIQEMVTNCDGTNKACSPAPDVVCEPYACSGTACLTTCTTTNDCAAGYYCELTDPTLLNTCQVATGLGQPCSSAAECATTAPYCVDGVCCTTECTDQCGSCGLLGTEGVCTAVSGDPVGGRPACASDGSVCGGQCNGVQRSACVFPDAAVECIVASCDPGTNAATVASACNSAGTCVTPAPVSCSPYVCDGDVCGGDCTSSAECESGLVCSGGMCIPPYGLGEACTGSGQCESGACVDGVCCDTSCTGQCEACNLSGREGTCSAVLGDPEPPRAACGGSGDCAGTCDGSARTSCSFPGGETECRAGECTGGTVTFPASCNGAGTCPAADTASCPGSGDCAGEACADPECIVSSDCSGSEVCRLGICVPAGQPGDACGATDECDSRFCVDGVCCDTACTGQCEACGLPGDEGTCTPVAAGDAPVGGRPACATDGTACGGACDGTTADRCAYPTDNCRTGSCDSGVAVLEASCDGAGSCPEVQEQDCGVFSCTGTGDVCNGDCASDPSACTAGNYCSAGVCVPELDDGATCSALTQCASGFCVDGVCCESACSGQCEACGEPGRLGECSFVSGLSRGGRPACPGTGPCASSCDGGSDTCAFPDASLECGPESCAAGAEREAATCNGAGSCERATPTACASLACDGDRCAAGCSQDSDCLGQQLCNSGTCEDPPEPTPDPGDGGAGGAPPDDDLTRYEGSCGCRIPGRTPAGSLPLLLLLAGVALARRRRPAA